MIEAKSFDDLAYTYNLVKARQIPIGIDLGRHANDHLYSFYFAQPVRLDDANMPGARAPPWRNRSITMPTSTAMSIAMK